MKPTLKAPGSTRLKLECDDPLSNFAFNFNLRNYNEVKWQALVKSVQHTTLYKAGGLRRGRLDVKAMVGRCRFTLSKPVLKAPMVSALETTMC